ncbi:MAG: IS5 family transposase [Candidatus Thermoplasmatota archaeon]|nr:IS5 family transposase [Candidatus Thermoplasmatota archaeon]MCL5794532.1 IS5 family transposase [Candidatus Thermoplasmatota archaeon]
MSDLFDTALKEKYRQYFVNDPLAFARDAIDWSAFPPLLKDLYHNDTDKGGRSNIPVITMVKVLYLQSLYNLADEQAEKEIHDRTSFMNFLDYPDLLPDAKTIWYFRERLSKTGRDRIIWNELKRQLEMKGIKVKKGSAQDATFITSDPGHVKHDEPRSEGKTRRSRDGSFTKKNSKTFFGYKGHTIVDDNDPVPFIRFYAVTTAKDHDTRIDLSKRGITVYRDKGYFGSDPNGMDGTMDRAVRNHKLSIESIRRNRRISRRRSLVEYPYAVMKRMFHFSHVMVNIVRRVRVKFMFACFGYNVHALKIVRG